MLKCTEFHQIPHVLNLFHLFFHLKAKNWLLKAVRVDIFFYKFFKVQMTQTQWHCYTKKCRKSFFELFCIVMRFSLYIGDKQEYIVHFVLWFDIIYFRFSYFSLKIIKNYEITYQKQKIGFSAVKMKMSSYRWINRSGSLVLTNIHIHYGLYNTNTNIYLLWFSSDEITNKVIYLMLFMLISTV